MPPTVDAHEWRQVVIQHRSPNDPQQEWAEPVEMFGGRAGSQVVEILYRATPNRTGILLAKPVWQAFGSNDLANFPQTIDSVKVQMAEDLAQNVNLGDF